MDHYYVNDTAQPTGEHEVHTGRHEGRILIINY